MIYNLWFSFLYIFSTLLLSYKGPKDPIPEEEFEFQGLEDEEEDGANQEKKNGAGAEKSEKGGNENGK